MFKKIFLIISMLPTVIGATETQKRWSGLYIGGNVGGIFNYFSLDAQHDALASWDGTCQHKEHLNSAFIGPQAGLMRQFDSNLVLGAEGDFTYNFSQNKSVTCQCDNHPEFYDNFNLSNQQQGSIRGRVGYAYKKNLLPFLTAGASFAKIGIHYTNEVNDEYAVSSVQPGWMVGAGLEWSYSEKLSARVEYGYNQYNKLDLSIPTIYGLFDSAGNARLSLSSNTIRGVINYWF